MKNHSSFSKSNLAYLLAKISIFSSTVQAEETPEQPTEAPDAPFDGNRNLWSTYSMIGHLVPILNDPEDGSMPPARTYIFQYGCYCFPDRYEVTGSRNGYHGDGVDDLDNGCRKLHRAQRCLEDKFEAEGRFCNITELYPYYMDSSTNEVVCGRWHPDFPHDFDDADHEECLMANCELEKSFAETVKQLVVSGYTQSSQFAEVTDDRYGDVCVSGDKITRPDSRNKPPTECCGFGIEQKMYNPQVNQCCQGKISAFGTC